MLSRALITSASKHACCVPNIFKSTMSFSNCTITNLLLGLGELSSTGNWLSEK